MLANGQTIIQLFEQYSPKHLAMPDDRIGLQLGTLNKSVSNVLITLDVTDEIVDEAIEKQAELIIAHHAIIYKPLKTLRTDIPSGKLYEKLIKNDIAVYIAHTNLDVSDGGMNDILAAALGLQNTTHLEDVHTDQLRKLVVFIPESHLQVVQDAIFQAGAGWIGNYSHCSFNISGVGTYMPREGSDPYQGQQGKLEQTNEVRFETIVPESLVRKTVQAMLKAHPYEEVAYDLYPVDLKGRTFGIGRIGQLPYEMALDAFADHVKQAFDVPAVRVVGSPDCSVRKVAVLGGAGRSFAKAASFAGADVLVTGDIDYHTAHDAVVDGLSIIDAGHNIEKLFKPVAARELQQKLAKEGYTTNVIASSVNTEVFRFR